MDAPAVIFVAALIAASAGVLAGLGGLWLAREQAATERAMRQRLEGLVEQISGGDKLRVSGTAPPSWAGQVLPSPNGAANPESRFSRLAAVVLLITDN